MKGLQGKRIGQRREPHYETIIYTEDNKSKGMEQTAT